MTVPTLRASRSSGAALAAALVLCGCASSPSTGPGTGGATATGATTSSSPGSEQPTTGGYASQHTVRITVTVVDGKASPPAHAVELRKGDHVELVVTSDRDDELHVHGYDIEKPLPAGQPVEVDFDADQQGRFEVETHESETVLLQLLVR